MNSRKIDYDQISATYNRRYDHNKMEQLIEEVKSCVKIDYGDSILEVGCGTAYWLNLFSQHTNKLFGTDLSLGMLNQAFQRNQSFNLVQANADLLPFKYESFANILCINALHFFDQNKFFSSCNSFLNQEGKLVLVILDLHSPQSDWYAYKYFSGIKQFDYSRFKPVNEIIENLKQNNFTEIKYNTVQKIKDVFVNEEVFNDPFLSKEESSTLAWLSDKEYSKGLGKIRNDISKAMQNKEQINFIKEFYFVLITAQKKNL